MLTFTIKEIGNGLVTFCFDADTLRRMAGPVRQAAFHVTREDDPSPHELSARLEALADLFTVGAYAADLHGTVDVQRRPHLTLANWMALETAADQRQ